MHTAARIALAAALVVGCGGAQNPQTQAKEAPAEPAKAEPAEAPVAEATPDTPPPKKAEPLTDEEIALIETDPAELTPEMRRKRAFALRKKIMQNPDSPAARNLEDIRRRIESGEITPDLPPKISAPVPAGHPPSSIPEEGATKPATDAPPAG
ncbi:MAG: hypothetical protein R3A79_20340 [Nannocystaceae bacterium]